MAISVVQTQTNTGASVSSLAVTLTSTQAQSTIIVAVAAQIGSVSTVQTSGGQSLALAVSQSELSQADAEIWYLDNVPSGQTSVTVTFAASVNGVEVVAYEVSGVYAAGGSLDQTSPGANTASSSFSWSSGTTATLAQSSEIAIGIISTFASTATITGPSSPWTNTAQLNSGSFRHAMAGSNIVASTTGLAYSGSETFTGTGYYAAVIATFKAGTPPAGGGPAGTVQPESARPAPRRKLTRAIVQHITGQAFVKVPAPAQEYQTPPRRRPGRALVRFTPVTTTNALPPPPPSGTVQPAAATPAPRRKPGRGIARGLAVPGIRGTAPAQEYRTPPRRRLSRALVRFTPVATINAPRNLLVSIAAQAGTDDYGTAFPQGILATAGVIEGPEIIGSDAFFYSSKTLGGLTQSITAADGTDAYGNAYIAGTATYANNGTFWSAIVVNSGVVSWYMATTAAGPWTSEAGIGFSWNNLTGGGLNFTGPAGNGMTGDLNVTGNVTVSATLTVNGTNIGSKISNIISALSGASTTTNGLTDGTINGTSGAASAGTAHTHGAGSYAVTNGQHHHVLPTVP